ncbi:RtcB family protein [Maricaulis virginensis]|uniref:3'-phosphate/5'-hydroxy nucleic acid ligase n=1 Tax=Maricaulis virginensis TaxID=144022 RepID=A0A9W6IJV5_9PROT|nr:RtcB family protein [Maricaulis virginensis]GLK51248.1 RNA-splicing ligase RtcB [Maricaulis virginensis]
MSVQFEAIETRSGVIKAWTRGVPVEDAAIEQLRNVAGLPFVHSHVAAMPDVHFGRGATVGSVIPTKGAIIPAAVGVDIGCGMMAVRTSLKAAHLPDSLKATRDAIERAVPVGNGKGGDHRINPASVETQLKASGLMERLATIKAKHHKIGTHKVDGQLGTLGGGNHFIELCLDEAGAVWVMLHSGSRGTGNMIGTYFIERAREELARRVLDFHVPDKDLAFFLEGEPLFDDYVEAVGWAQDYARENREAMMMRVLGALRTTLGRFKTDKAAVNCHHNYVEQEHHFGADVWLTRKGAVSARDGELGIIPGSMGARSFIVRGKGAADSFCSCSHGAGRTMSRSKARQAFTLADHRKATEGVECRKDAGVIDETPMAYKDIDAVMAAQSDLVEVVHTLKQVVCVKG